MVGYSDGTSEHEEWFKDGRRSVYKERLFGVGVFPFLLSLLVLLSSKASTTLNQLRFLSCPDFLDTNFELRPDYDITFKLLISPAHDPARHMTCERFRVVTTKCCHCKRYIWSHGKHDIHERSHDCLVFSAISFSLSLLDEIQLNLVVKWSCSIISPLHMEAFKH